MVRLKRRARQSEAPTFMDVYQQRLAQEPLKKLSEISTDLALARCPLRSFIVTKFITCAFGRWV